MPHAPGVNKRTVKECVGRWGIGRYVEKQEPLEAGVSGLDTYCVALLAGIDGKRRSEVCHFFSRTETGKIEYWPSSLHDVLRYKLFIDPVSDEVVEWMEVLQADETLMRHLYQLVLGLEVCVLFLFVCLVLIMSLLAGECVGRSLSNEIV